MSGSNTIFLLAYDHSNHYRISINIVEPLIRTSQEIGSYYFIPIIIDDAANYKLVGAIIKDMYANIFWSRVWFQTLNFLMHDIINMKDYDYNGFVHYIKGGRK